MKKPLHLLTVLVAIPTCDDLWSTLPAFVTLQWDWSWEHTITRIFYAADPTHLTLLKDPSNTASFCTTWCNFRRTHRTSPALETNKLLARKTAAFGHDKLPTGTCMKILSAAMNTTLKRGHILHASLSHSSLKFLIICGLQQPPKRKHDH